MILKRHHCVWLLVVELAGLACANPHQQANEPLCDRCNVLLISLDTLRADHLGIYGYRRPTSPNIDRIGEQGIVFEQAYAQASWTLPSHMSILTGLYPSRHQVVYTKSTLASQTPTLAEFLADGGYATAAFTGGGYVRRRWGYEGFDVFVEQSGDHETWEGQWRAARQAARWLESAQQPFFLFWHTYGSHAPYDPPREFDSFADPDYSGPVNPKPGDELGQCGSDPLKACVQKQARYYAHLRRTGRLDETDLAHVLDKYDGEVRAADEIVGYLWSALESIGRDRDTVFVVLSDHGESFEPEGTRRAFGHPNPYLEVIRIPWVMAIPGAESQRLKDPVESIDLVPTIAAILGLQLDGRVDGANVFDKNSRSQFAISEHWRVEDKELAALSVIWREWHAINWSDGRADSMELYDIEQDPGERLDVSAQHADVVARLTRAATDWAKSLDDPEGQTGREVELDPETRRELEALGYL